MWTKAMDVMVHAGGKVAFGEMQKRLPSALLLQSESVSKV